MTSGGFTAHQWTALNGEGGPTPRRYVLDTLFVLIYAYSDLTLPPRLAFVQFGGDPWAWVQLVLQLVFLGGVLLRWKWPLASFAVVTAIALTYMFTWGGAPFVVAAWVLYPTALTARPLSRLQGLLLVAGGAVAALVVSWAIWTDPLLLVLPSLTLASPFVFAWLLGRLVRAGHLQRQRDSAAVAAGIRSEERLRVAREIHDVVSHALGAIGMRAGVARYVVEDDPRALREALTDIESTTRAATDELRLLLGALRTDGEAPRTPQAGLSDLAGLADTARAAGVDCVLSTHGADDLPAAVALGVHRVVQESVTNVIRHAPGATCTITVNGGPDAVEVEVADTGPARAQAPFLAPGSGAGHVGMRERVTLLKGRLTVGPSPDGGYRVHARIPFDNRTLSGPRTSEETSDD
ncbi:sensor histidine kinase [Nocardiopsis nanhaiensis]